MTFQTCSLCAGVVMGVSKIAPSNAQLGGAQGGRHRGRQASMIEELFKTSKRQGRHARARGRHK